MSCMTRVYLDHNATSPLRPQAQAAMLAAMETLGNPSSVHAEGRAARALLEEARARIARGIGASPRNLAFVSGATEAANLALTPHIQRGRDHEPFEILLVGAGEHLAVMQGHRFPAGSVEQIALARDGALSLRALETALGRHAGRRIMLALQAVNNETGVIQPVHESAERIHACGGLLVCDATQAVGRMETTLQSTGADILFFSSHKLGGPMGVGALVFGSDDLHIAEGLVRGGGQESGRRGGTENLAGVAGFAAAFESAAGGLEAEAMRLAELRDMLEQEVAGIAPGVRFFGREAPRAPNTSAFALPDHPARTLLIALDLEGVAVSSGSACSSGKVKESHVLAAMGTEEKEAIRVSLGWSSTREHVEEFGKVLGMVVDRMRSRHSAA